MYDVRQLVGPLPSSCGYALNKHGDVVGYTADAPGDGPAQVEAAIWFSSGRRFFAPPATSALELRGINNHRNAVGGIGRGSEVRPLWIDGDGALRDPFAELGFLDLVGEASAINDRGTICVEYPGLLIETDPLGIVDLGFTERDNLRLSAINNAGDVAGTFLSGGRQRGFLRRAHGDVVDLGADVLGDDMGLNNGSSVVVVGTLVHGGPDSPSPRQPVFWELGATGSASPEPTLAPLPEGCEEALFFGVNDAKQMVGTAESPQGPRAFIYDQVTGPTDLNSQISDPRWVLTDAYAINNAGQITGRGLLNGVETAYLLTPEESWPRMSERDSLLQFLWVSLGVKVDAGGPTSGGPIGPIDPELRNALLGLGLEAAARRVSDNTGREAIRTAALEMTRRSVDRMIARAKAPAPAQIRTVEARPGRGRFSRSRTRLKDAPKT
jgi:hypothetical protein